MSFNVTQKGDMYFVSNTADGNVICRTKNKDEAIAECKDLQARQDAFMSSIKGNVSGDLAMESKKVDE